MTRHQWSGQPLESEASSVCYSGYFVDPRRISSDIKQTLDTEQRGFQQRISDTLKRAGIKLEKGETLNFTVGSGGKLIVDPKGLSGSKATAIEKALNQDAELVNGLRLNAAGKMLNGHSGFFGASSVMRSDHCTRQKLTASTITD